MIRLFIRQYSSSFQGVSKIKQKLDKLPIKISTNLLDLKTINRLDACNIQFLEHILTNLDTFGIKDKHLCDTLRTYENWDSLTKENIENTWNICRECSLNNQIFATLLSKNPKIIDIDKKYLNQRLYDFKNFFSRKHLERLLLRTPDLLTANMDLFSYKFNYVFALMGIDQKEMSTSCVFSYPIQHIRQRHLFLERSALYEKPKKKLQNNNPKLSFIVDLNLKQFLKLCTQDIFTVEDFDVFCNYLCEENFDNELLGLRIGKYLKNQILDSISYQKKIDRQIDEID
ncbi:transcription termination factor mitochondrial [Brachionus plicatilis]|uniref:Transcription termination factor mitochondrial n=1 Tax=Brachionus plicatilis TaxID=10195 RepID=A0A3M7SW17_BRAPC|nr:transcription termination factor mitochondrial [Brachionus plicatilis]